MLTALANLDVASLLIGAVIGAPLGFWFSSFCQRPRLDWDGTSSGSGGPGGWAQINVRVTNRPGFVGIRLGETTVFGRRLHAEIECGWHIERGPARDCAAFMYDIESGDCIPLYFRDPARPEAFANGITIQSGRKKDLLLMAHQNGDFGYFPFAPKWGDPNGVALPDTALRYRATKKFRVVISYGPSGSAKLKKRLRIVVGALRPPSRIWVAWTRGRGIVLTTWQSPAKSFRRRSLASCRARDSGGQ